MTSKPESAKMKYTPGPWTFRGMFEFSQNTKSFHIIGGVTKADAHLIAAAPELLEALKVCAIVPGFFLLPEIRKQMNAAIAKAEGR